MTDIVRDAGGARRLPEDDGPGIAVTALYVYQRLAAHEKVCSARWLKLLIAVLTGQTIIIGQLLLLYMQRHP